jgi:hypothetical protein
MVRSLNFADFQQTHWRRPCKFLVLHRNFFLFSWLSSAVRVARNAKTEAQMDKRYTVLGGGTAGHSYFTRNDDGSLKCECGHKETSRYLMQTHQSAKLVQEAA